MKNESTSEPKFSTKTSAAAEPALMELFLDSIKDIYWAENHLVKSLPKMQEAATSSELAGAISEHLIQTKGHVSRLNFWEKSHRLRNVMRWKGLPKKEKEL
jgi:ferritin-like metal-binding protein YciE